MSDGADTERRIGNTVKTAKSKAEEELAKLKFEKKNQSMAKLPLNMTVERRPLLHAPIASPFAGVSAQKVVYVSCNTPIMAAVKRVKKLLLHVEKRALQGVDLTKDRNGMRKLAEANEKLGRNGEAVYVKASGRAMEQALRVGEWFRSREDELMCNVVVRTGSVQAVDDIVEKEGDDSTLEDQPSGTEDTSELENQDASLMTVSESHEDPTQAPMKSSSVEERLEKGFAVTDEVRETKGAIVAEAGDTPKKRRRRGKRKKNVLDEDTSARIRWVKTVEVAISFKC